MSVLRIGLVVVLAVAVAVAANLALLGVANGSNDPVGRLSPRSELVRLPARTTPAPPLVTTTQPHGEGSSGTHQDD